MAKLLVGLLGLGLVLGQEVNTLTNTHAHTHTHRHALVHTHTHTHTHTYTHTHTHTHTHALRQAHAWIKRSLLACRVSTPFVLLSLVPDS
jgi:ABC-type Zn2+ transport system substrate-binding protein/surface adhesin